MTRSIINALRMDARELQSRIGITHRLDASTEPYVPLRATLCEGIIGLVARIAPFN